MFSRSRWNKYISEEKAANGRKSNPNIFRATTTVEQV